MHGFADMADRTPVRTPDVEGTPTGPTRDAALNCYAFSPSSLATSSCLSGVGARMAEFDCHVPRKGRSAASPERSSTPPRPAIPVSNPRGSDAPSAVVLVTSGHMYDAAAPPAAGLSRVTPSKASSTVGSITNSRRQHAGHPVRTPYTNGVLSDSVPRRASGQAPATPHGGGHESDHMYWLQGSPVSSIQASDSPAHLQWRSGGKPTALAAASHAPRHSELQEGVINQAAAAATPLSPASSSPTLSALLRASEGWHVSPPWRTAPQTGAATATTASAAAAAAPSPATADAPASASTPLLERRSVTARSDGDVAALRSHLHALLAQRESAASAGAPAGGAATGVAAGAATVLDRDRVASRLVDGPASWRADPSLALPHDVPALVEMERAVPVHPRLARPAPLLDVTAAAYTSDFPSPLPGRPVLSSSSPTPANAMHARAGGAAAAPPPRPADGFAPRLGGAHHHHHHYHHLHPQTQRSCPHQYHDHEMPQPPLLRAARDPVPGASPSVGHSGRVRQDVRQGRAQQEFDAEASQLAQQLDEQLELVFSLMRRVMVLDAQLAAYPSDVAGGAAVQLSLSSSFADATEYRESLVGRLEDSEAATVATALRFVELANRHALEWMNRGHYSAALQLLRRADGLLRQDAGRLFRYLPDPAELDHPAGRGAERGAAADGHVHAGSGSSARGVGGGMRQEAPALHGGLAAAVPRGPTHADVKSALPLSTSDSGASSNHISSSDGNVRSINVPFFSPSQEPRRLKAAAAVEHNLGIYHFKLGEYGVAAARFARTAALEEELGASGVGITYFNMAQTQHGMRQLGEALRYAELAEEAVERQVFVTKDKATQMRRRLAQTRAFVTDDFPDDVAGLEDGARALESAQEEGGETEQALIRTWLQWRESVCFMSYVKQTHAQWLEEMGLYKAAYQHYLQAHRWLLSVPRLAPEEQERAQTLKQFMATAKRHWRREEVEQELYHHPIRTPSASHEAGAAVGPRTGSRHRTRLHPHTRARLSTSASAAAGATAIGGGSFSAGVLGAGPAVPLARGFPTPLQSTVVTSVLPRAVEVIAARTRRPSLSRDPASLGAAPPPPPLPSTPAPRQRRPSSASAALYSVYGPRRPSAPHVAQRHGTGSGNVGAEGAAETPVQRHAAMLHTTHPPIAHGARSPHRHPQEHRYSGGDGRPAWDPSTRVPPAPLPPSSSGARSSSPRAASPHAAAGQAASSQPPRSPPAPSVVTSPAERGVSRSLLFEAEPNVPKPLHRFSRHVPGAADGAGKAVSAELPATAATQELVERAPSLNHVDAAAPGKHSDAQTASSDLVTSASSAARTATTPGPTPSSSRIPGDLTWCVTVLQSFLRAHSKLCQRAGRAEAVEEEENEGRLASGAASAGFTSTLLQDTRLTTRSASADGSTTHEHPSHDTESTHVPHERRDDTEASVLTPRSEGPAATPVDADGMNTGAYGAASRAALTSPPPPQPPCAECLDTAAALRTDTAPTGDLSVVVVHDDSNNAAARAPVAYSSSDDESAEGQTAASVAAGACGEVSRHTAPSVVLSLPSGRGSRSPVSLDALVAVEGRAGSVSASTIVDGEDAAADEGACAEVDSRTADDAAMPQCASTTAGGFHCLEANVPAAPALADAPLHELTTAVGSRRGSLHAFCTEASAGPPSASGSSRSPSSAAAPIATAAAPRAEIPTAASSFRGSQCVTHAEASVDLSMRSSSRTPSAVMTPVTAAVGAAHEAELPTGASSRRGSLHVLRAEASVEPSVVRSPRAPSAAVVHATAMALPLHPLPTAASSFRGSLHLTRAEASVAASAAGSSRAPSTVLSPADVALAGAPMQELANAAVNSRHGSLHAFPAESSVSLSMSHTSRSPSAAVVAVPVTTASPPVRKLATAASSVRGSQCAMRAEASLEQSLARSSRTLSSATPPASVVLGSPRERDLSAAPSASHHLLAASPAELSVARSPPRTPGAVCVPTTTALLCVGEMPTAASSFRGSQCVTQAEDSTHDEVAPPGARSSPARSTARDAEAAATEASLSVSVSQSSARASEASPPRSPCGSRAVASPCAAGGPDAEGGEAANGELRKRTGASSDAPAPSPAVVSTPSSPRTPSQPVLRSPHDALLDAPVDNLDEARDAPEAETSLVAPLGEETEKVEPDTDMQEPHQLNCAPVPPPLPPLPPPPPAQTPPSAVAATAAAAAAGAPAPPRRRRILVFAPHKIATPVPTELTKTTPASASAVEGEAVLEEAVKSLLHLAASHTTGSLDAPLSFNEDFYCAPAAEPYMTTDDETWGRRTASMVSTNTQLTQARESSWKSSNERSEETGAAPLPTGAAAAAAAAAVALGAQLLGQLDMVRQARPSAMTRDRTQSSTAVSAAEHSTCVALRETAAAAAALAAAQSAGGGAAAPSRTSSASLLRPHSAQQLLLSANGINIAQEVDAPRQSSGAPPTPPTLSQAAPVCFLLPGAVLGTVGSALPSIIATAADAAEAEAPHLAPMSAAAAALKAFIEASSHISLSLSERTPPTAGGGVAPPTPPQACPVPQPSHGPADVATRRAERPDVAETEREVCDGEGLVEEVASSDGDVDAPADLRPSVSSEEGNEGAAEVEVSDTGGVEERLDEAEAGDGTVSDGRDVVAPTVLHYIAERPSWLQRDFQMLAHRSAIAVPALSHGPQLLPTPPQEPRVSSSRPLSDDEERQLTQSSGAPRSTSQTRRPGVNDSAWTEWEADEALRQYMRESIVSEEAATVIQQAWRDYAALRLRRQMDVSW